MSGIALIIPGADFNDSSLGKVTFKKSIKEKAAEAVDAYTSVLGSHTYDDELALLVATLMTAGVWDNIGVFPMLGDTLAKRMTPLNVDGNATISSLVYPETAVLDAEKGEVKFTNSTLNPTFVGTVKSYSVVGAKKAFAFADFQRASLSPNNSSLTEGTCLALGTTSEGDGFNARPKITIPSTIATTGSTQAIPQNGNVRIKIGAYIGNSNLSIYKDGTLYKSDAVNSVTTKYYNYNILGAGTDVGAESTVLFDGWCSFYAHGLIEDESKVASVVSAFQTFLDSVKP